MSFCVLEDGDNGFYLRGKGEITGRFVTIVLPSYLPNVANDFTISITPIIKRNQTPKTYNKIYVATDMEINKYTNNLEFDVFGEVGRFHWTVFAKKVKE
jgi:hypothetical protein